MYPLGDKKWLSPNGNDYNLRILFKIILINAKTLLPLGYCGQLKYPTLIDGRIYKGIINAL